MLILGLLLIIAALVVFGYMFLGTNDLDAMDIDLGIFTVQLTPLHLYLLGAATLIVLVLGLLALAAGMRAARRRRREVKELRKAVRDGGPEHDRRDERAADRRDDAELDDDRRRADRNYDDDRGRADRTYDDGPADRPAERHDPAAAPVDDPHRTDSTPYEREVAGDSPSVGGTRTDDRGIAIPSDYTPTGSRDTAAAGHNTTSRGDENTLPDGTPRHPDDDRR